MDSVLLASVLWGVGTLTLPRKNTLPNSNRLWNASKFVLKLTTLTSRVAAKRDPKDPTFIPHTRHSPRDSDIDESMEDDPALPEDPALPPISFSMTLCFLVFTFRGGCEIGITLKSF
jgi:hypothetical protein